MATLRQALFSKPDVSTDEDRRQLVMARLFFATFWSIFFVGAVRKWMFPNFGLLYLAQDLPIALAYLYAFRAGFVRRTPLLWGFLLLSAVVMLQAFTQMLVLGLPPLVTLVGLHHYIFYIPIMIIFPTVLNEFQRRKFIVWNMLLVIPTAVIAVMQSVSPKTAFINLTAGGEAMGVSGSDVVRSTGTFNFTVPYGLWVAIAFSLVVGEWLQPKQLRVLQSNLVMIVSSVAGCLCFLVAGGRSVILLSTCALVGGMMAAVLKGSKRALMTVAGGVIVMPMLVGLTAVIAPHEYDILVLRFTGDRYVDEAQNRTATIAVGFLTDAPVSLLGVGIGMGIDAAHLGDPQALLYAYKYSEYDTTRIVTEAGTATGLLYVGTRLFFSFGMILLCIHVVRRGGPPHVLPLGTAMFAQCYMGDLTRLGTSTFSQVALVYAFVLGAEIYSREQSTVRPDGMFNRTRFA